MVLIIVSTLGYIFTDHKSVTFKIEDKIEKEDGTYQFVSGFNKYPVTKDVYDWYDEGDTFYMSNNSMAHGIWAAFLFLSLAQILYMLLDRIYDDCKNKQIC